MVFENTLFMVHFGSLVTYSPIWCALTCKYSELRGKSGNFGEGVNVAFPRQIGLLHLGNTQMTPHEQYGDSACFSSNVYLL